MRFYTIVLCTASLLIFNGLKGQSLVLKTDQPVSRISPVMWGVFFEDINLGADGGIYAELIKNRSFEFLKPLMGWTKLGKKTQEGDVVVLNRQSKPSNPRFVRLLLRGAGAGDAGLSNEGFRGMGIKEGIRYDFSVMVRTSSSNTSMKIMLVDTLGNSLGETTMRVTSSTDWLSQKASFTATRTFAKAHLEIWMEGDGTIDLDMVSLFPADTWKGRPGGMRADMVQWLADLKPGFIRFPGGCIVEGVDLANRYRWKNTIGKLEDRQLMLNRWNAEFAHRPTPDYFQTFGLGFYEYFQLAVDIGAEPLPILNCGMACQFNSAELVPLDELDPFVQDALDLIEFANADTTSAWGKTRASLGHPAPFNLKMIGIGNENWGPQYLERLAIFTKAIKAKYPQVKIINSSGTDPDGDRFTLLDTDLRRTKADLIDEHFYRRPEWFLANAGRYDNYVRNGALIFAGEYAAQTDHTVSVDNKNNWRGAIAEAAFMTGLERNAEVIAMASYAPLFAHEDGWQWKPDLIWVNNLQSFGTPNYYVQKLFATNKGDAGLSFTCNGKTMKGEDSLYAVASFDSATSDVVIKLVNASGLASVRTINIEGRKKPASMARALVMQSTNLETENTFSNPTLIAPVARQLAVKGRELVLKLEPYSFQVIRVKLKK